MEPDFGFTSQHHHLLPEQPVCLSGLPCYLLVKVDGRIKGDNAWEKPVKKKTVTVIRISDARLWLLSEN